MRPPMATDHTPERRLRILYTKKHAPYNSHEERTLIESSARRLVIMGVAIPAPVRDDLRDLQGRPMKDIWGGWTLTGQQAAQAENLPRARKEAAGDFSKQQEDEERDREDEELRVMDAAQEEDRAKARKQEEKEAAKSTNQKFLKGKK